LSIFEDNPFFNMIRTLFILIFSLLFFYSSIGQNITHVTSDSCLLTNRFKGYLFLVKEKLVVDSIYNIYSDSLPDFVNKEIENPVFVYSLIDASSTTHDALILSAYKIPFVIKPLGWTSDYENIFSKKQITELDSILTEFEKQTENEIAVVTIDSSWTTDEKFDSLISSITDFWGVGKKNSNNGIVIGISKGLKIIRINNEYGIQTKLTDNETKEIIDDIIIPEFKKGNYFEGTKKGILALMQKIR
jgi:uncharacterized protein